MDVLYDFVNSGNPERRDHCNAVIRDGELADGMDRVTGDYSEFWAARDLQNDLDRIEAATLMSHAFNDWNVMPEHSVRVYEYLKAKGVPAQAYFHQGGHGGPPPLELMNRWFTRYLYGVENGVENDPKAWIVREGAERSDPTPYPDYPHPEATPVTLHLRAGGHQQGGLGLAANAGQGTETLVDNFSFSGTVLERRASPCAWPPVHRRPTSPCGSFRSRGARAGRAGAVRWSVRAAGSSHAAGRTRRTTPRSRAASCWCRVSSTS
jgi:X-Pro dipeptidyl-peptidase